MENSEIKISKKKSRKQKPELIIVEEISPKNITLKSSSSSKGKKRCKKGTQKFKPLGPGCFTSEEIKNYKLTKINKKKTNKKTKKAIELEIIEEPFEIIPQKRIETEIILENKSTKRRLKTPIELEIMEEKKRYNEDFIELMEKLSNIMLKQGEPFRARAYQKAQETIMTYQNDITSPDQLKGLPGIGSTIMEKLKEYVETGTLRVLEREKTNPINILGEIYGIGPKKAQELVNVGVKNIDDLKSRQNDLLNDVQKTGLKYHEQIQERIPRSEIEEFEQIFKEIFKEAAKGTPESKFEIVGSYRRGAQTSGDIDVIITGNSGNVYKKFIDDLLKTGIILEILSRGQSKTLVIAKLPGERIARRIDFLYAPPDEYAFAILYFTGSKTFNTVMRQYGLDKGFTFNEHGIYKLENKKKGAKVNNEFKTEKDIFDFLGLQFKTPIERRDGRAVQPYTDVGEQIEDSVKKAPTPEKAEEEVIEIIPAKKNKTLKKRKPKMELEIVGEELPKVTTPLSIDILSIIEDFKHNGISVLESLNEKQLSEILRLSNFKYYNETQVMSDNQYDIVKEFTEQKFPNNVAVTEIGAEVERNKVKLPYEMASMDKIKPDTNALTSWMSKL